MRDVAIAWSIDGPGGPRATGRALLRELGAGEVVAICPGCGGAHGRPRVGRGEVTIAHAAGTTLVALSQDHPIGADLERADARPPDRSLRRWTEIEAVLKADGRGLEVDPARIRFAGGQAVLEGVVYDLEPIAIDGFIATLALSRLAGRAAPAARSPAATPPRIPQHPRRPR